MGRYPAGINCCEDKVMSVNIRSAVQADLPVILQFIHDLAEYEKAPDEVELSLDDLKESLFGVNPQVFCLISEKLIMKLPGLQFGT